ncbi:MAG: hypothetical protein DMG50_00315, partial [Acidobacteria bacterium]
CFLPNSEKKIARAVPGVSSFHDTADGKVCTARGFPCRVSENGMGSRGNERLARGKREEQRV